MHGQYSKSLASKTLLAILHAFALCVSAWILVGSGLHAFSHWKHKSFSPGPLLNRELVFACAAIYFARICFGTFYLVQRKFSWGEALGIGLFVLFIHALFAFFGAVNPRPPAALAILGAFLYLLGSVLNTGSELSRHLWKKIPANRGHLYTQGLFRFSRHINYFGDELLFTGYALITGSLWCLVVPALMIFGFLFVSIPMLDAYLAQKYPAEFPSYASHTKKFFPFLY